MRVTAVEWISEVAREAEVMVAGGEISCRAFSQPCLYSVGDEVGEPLRVFGLRQAQLSTRASPALEKLADNDFSYRGVGRLLDPTKQIMSVGGLLLQIDDDLPGGLQAGDMVEFECGRVDLW